MYNFMLQLYLIRNHKLCLWVRLSIYSLGQIPCLLGGGEKDLGCEFVLMGSLEPSRVSVQNMGHQRLRMNWPDEEQDRKVLH